MVFDELTNSNPMTLCGMAIKQDADVFTIPTDTYSPMFCYCQYECNECAQVFGGSDLDWQNDRTSFAFIKTIPTDTFGLTLWKNGTQVATITDNTYGIFVASYTDNPKQYSFVINWDLVYNAFGGGSYVLKNNYTVVGVAKEFVSNEYCLSLFDDVSADGYVKFEWYQSGKIESNPFSFCEPLYHSIRIKGGLLLQSPETIKDSYQTSTRENKMFRTEQKNSYLFKSKLIRENSLSLLNNNMFLSEKLTVTDFNLFGTKFIQKDLSFVEVSNLEDYVSSTKIELDFLMEDFKQNILKDNCC